jgi:hypothetical protein
VVLDDSGRQSNAGPSQIGRGRSPSRGGTGKFAIYRSTRFCDTPGMQRVIAMVTGNLMTRSGGPETRAD